ncbi:potassium channel family protein [Kutzneria sp. CA-103260]|uniref:potassium channel family protein n=1 Tax=Kutzneria sp. CA-103260 TaxID=2802641 RepID=UPI001BEEF8E7|nr:potassium channel family protein [Kutzneria sp. CA-103260]QUQ66215.1 two pore domain potassium channel family protein [Kutzneria sp. CA-103260]
MSRTRMLRRVTLAALRPVLSVVALVTLYYVLPMNRPAGVGAFALLAAGLAAVVGVVVWQTRAILRSTRPVAQGVQALAVAIPLFLLVFASAYHLLATDVPGSFNQSLTRTDALYFAVTVFATVGFGDIVAVSQQARIVVTVQMVGDLLVLGVVLRVLLGAVQRRRHDRGS